MEIIPFKIAKKLKEKGFRELCTHFYRYGTLKPQEIFCALRSNAHHKWSFNSMDAKLKDTYEQVQVNMVDAPTITQVLKWLREEKKMHLIVEISDRGWYYTLYPNVRWEDGVLKSDKYFMSFKHKQSFELASIAGIEYVLDNLI